MSDNNLAHVQIFAPVHVIVLLGCLSHQIATWLQIRDRMT